MSGGGWSPRGYSKKECDDPKEAVEIWLCSTDTCCVGREGNRAATFSSLWNSRVSSGILISTSAAGMHHLYREVGVSKKQCWGIMCSLRNCPITHQLETNYLSRIQITWPILTSYFFPRRGKGGVILSTKLVTLSSVFPQQWQVPQTLCVPCQWTAPLWHLCWCSDQSWNSKQSSNNSWQELLMEAASHMWPWKLSITDVQTQFPLSTPALLVFN